MDIKEILMNLITFIIIILIVKCWLNHCRHSMLTADKNICPAVKNTPFKKIAHKKAL